MHGHGMREGCRRLRRRPRLRHRELHGGQDLRRRGRAESVRDAELREARSVPRRTELRKHRERLWWHRELRRRVCCARRLRRQRPAERLRRRNDRGPRRRRLRSAGGLPCERLRPDRGRMRRHARVWRVHLPGGVRRRRHPEQVRWRQSVHAANQGSCLRDDELRLRGGWLRRPAHVRLERSADLPDGSAVRPLRAEPVRQPSRTMHRDRRCDAVHESFGLLLGLVRSGGSLSRGRMQEHCCRLRKQQRVL